MKERNEIKSHTYTHTRTHANNITDKQIGINSSDLQSDITQTYIHKTQYKPLKSDAESYRKKSHTHIHSKHTQIDK